MTTLSVIIPIHNEEESLCSLIPEVYAALHELPSWELILVDDGSTDASWEVISRFAKEKKNLRAIKLQKNYGQTTAYVAGFQHSCGTFIATLDGDGQNNPFDIPKLLAIATQGNYHLVTGKRSKRKDSLIKKIISSSANSVRNRILHDPSTDTGCSLKIYRRSALETIKFFKGMHRFIPALFAIEGYRIYEVTVDHRPRLKGKSKYSLFSRGLSLVNDLFAVLWMKRRHIAFTVEATNNVD